MIYSIEDRMKIGHNISLLFENNSELLLGKGYRYTKTSYRDVSAPINLFKDYYLRTNETVFSRDTIEKKILLGRNGGVRPKSDVVQTGIRTMKMFLFLDGDSNRYILTHQFFEWIKSGEDFYNYFIDQALNIRSIHEIRDIYNALFCMLNEWIKNGIILDFSSYDDDEFVKKIKPKKVRIQYCKFVKDIYGFEGNCRKDSKKIVANGNYSPDILQRVRTVFLNTGIIKRIEKNEHGIQQFTLSDKGLDLLKKLNENMGIILENGNLDNCHYGGCCGETIIDAPRMKKPQNSSIRKNVGEKKERREPSSKYIKDNAKIAVDYICELEVELPNEKRIPLFIEKSSGLNYLEGHHFIPMEYASLFKYSIDVEANIICLCPRCHRLLHHGTDEERKVFINQLFNERKERLKKCELLKLKDGSDLTIETIYEFYKVG